MKKRKRKRIDVTYNNIVPKVEHALDQAFKDTRIQLLRNGHGSDMDDYISRKVRNLAYSVYLELKGE